MSYIESPDGETQIRETGSLPKNLTRRLDTGEWSVPDEPTAPDFGFHRVQESLRPDADHRRSVVNMGPGVFAEQWTFDQALADANEKAAQESAAAMETQRWADWFADAADRIESWPEPGNDGQRTAQIQRLKNIVANLCDWTSGRIVAGGYDETDQEPPGSDATATRMRT